MRRNPRGNPVGRFWSHVDQSGECWKWTGMTVVGYGTLRVNARPTKAHRFSWELHNGPIPDGLFVCHHCDNPACVRPSHLFLGTHSDNMRDMRAKGRAGHSVLGLGPDNMNTKLTPDQVRTIRRELREGTSTPAEQCRRYGVEFGTIRAIRRGVTWGWLAD